MPAPLKFVHTTCELPDAADAVVIGGGIIGVFSAYYLARRGLKVALVEKRKDRRGAIEPQLGLVPPAEPRRPRVADGDEEPRSLGALRR